MKVFVFGLDCAVPELVFEKFKDELPNLKMLMKKGVYGKIKSINPPITIPAWLCMFTGKNPGELGIYGFRHRKGNSYTDIKLTTSLDVREKAVWDFAQNEGKSVVLIGVPPSYPPKPVKGFLISDFMTPDDTVEFTYPKELKREVKNLVGEYKFDVYNFRSNEKDKILQEVYEMTEKRFQIVNKFIKKEWDLFVLVEIGLDRIHHAFWKYMDENHKRYCYHEKYSSVIVNYYKFLDKKIGEILKLLDDETVVLVVSDHGAKKMDGAFAVNEWLIREGYLKLKKYPESPLPIDKAEVDWNKTKAWGWGGYYARIFLNVLGREERGTVLPKDYENLRDEICEKLKNVKDDLGNKMKNLIFKPEEIYGRANGNPPDLMVIFDDLWWRAAGTIGHKRIYLSENDTGPDDAMHDWYGIFILYNPKKNFCGKIVKGLELKDVAAIVSRYLDVPMMKISEKIEFLFGD